MFGSPGLVFEVAYFKIQPAYLKINLIPHLNHIIAFHNGVLRGEKNK